MLKGQKSELAKLKNHAQQEKAANLRKVKNVAQKTRGKFDDILASAITGEDLQEKVEKISKKKSVDAMASFN